MLKTVVTTLGLVLAGCSVGAVNGAGGDDTTDGGITGDPRAGTFATEVVPLVSNKGCLNATCHGGIQNPQMMSFDKMTQNGPPGRYLITPAATNVIITKDDATPGMHQNAPYLDATDKAAISTWLETGP